MTDPLDLDRPVQPIADRQPGDVIRLADGSIAAMMATDVLNPWVVLDTTDNGDAIFLDEDSPDLAGAVLLLRDGRPVTPAATRAEAQQATEADPPTVLALLDALAAAQAERDAVRAELAHVYGRTNQAVDDWSGACSCECDGCNALVDALQAPLGVGLSDQPSRDFSEENGRLLAELAALRAQVEASPARARDAITEDATP